LGAKKILPIKLKSAILDILQKLETL
jgi:hypothetical protein